VLPPICAEGGFLFSIYHNFVALSSMAASGLASKQKAFGGLSRLGKFAKGIFVIHFLHNP